MPRISHDVRCNTCGADERDVLCSRSGDAVTVPRCACGGERRIVFLPAAPRRADNFSTVVLGGEVLDTPEKLRAYQQQYEARWGEPLVLEGRSRRGDRVRAEEDAQSQLDRVKALSHRGADWQRETAKRITEAANCRTRGAR